jgi:hypothetical protein
MDDFSVYGVDETGGVDNGMMGISSAINQSSAVRISPSRSLVYLWVVCLAVYWALGYLFKGQR